MNTQYTAHSSRQGREELYIPKDDPMMGGGYAMDRGSNISNISANSTCTASTGDSYNSFSPGTPNSSVWEPRSPVKLEYAPYLVPMANPWSPNSQNDDESDPPYVVDRATSSTLATSSWAASTTTQYFPQYQYPRMLEIQAAPSYVEPAKPAKPTPKSLQWAYLEENLKLYKFVVEKGKEPYFQLSPALKVTAEYPEKVYLDQPSHPKPGRHPCLYPIKCTGKQCNFSRPADLERHYKNVHCSQDSKEKFPCDYPKCSRHKDEDAFTRKDHYRDHLKDFHKEDIGSAKGEKNMKRKEWEKKQKEWLGERRISKYWWRCVRCLIRINIERSGWACKGCKGECEEERREARLKKGKGKGKNIKVDDVDEDVDEWYPESPGVCKPCGGKGWIPGEGGAWVLCLNCQQPQQPVGDLYSADRPVDNSWDNGMNWSYD